MKTWQTLILLAAIVSLHRKIWSWVLTSVILALAFLSGFGQ